MYYLFIVSPEVCVPSSPTGSESPVSSSVPSETASWSAPSSSSWHNTAIQNLSSLWIMALSYHWTDIVNAKGNMFIFKVKHSWIKTVLQGCHEPKFLKQHLRWRRKVTPYRNLKTSMSMISKHLKKKNLLQNPPIGQRRVGGDIWYVEQFVPVRALSCRTTTLHFVKKYFSCWRTLWKAGGIKFLNTVLTKSGLK